MFASRGRPLVVAVFAVVALLVALVIMAPSAAQEPPRPMFQTPINHGVGDYIDGTGWLGPTVSIEIWVEPAGTLFTLPPLSNGVGGTPFGGGSIEVHA